jgi:hypothetical protein
MWGKRGLVKRGIVAALLSTAVLASASGCALGTTPIRVSHSALVPAATLHQGTLLVRQFKDVRAEERRPYVGAKRNSWGMVLGHVALPPGESLEVLLTRYFAEALEDAGYHAELQLAGQQPPAELMPDAILDGEIEQFWLDLYVATWDQIRVAVTLRAPADEAVLWTSTIEGAETNVLWIGATAEYEKVVRQALDHALARAVAEFSSDDFYRAVCRARALEPATAGAADSLPGRSPSSGH